MAHHLNPEENMFLLGVARHTAWVATRFLLSGQFRAELSEEIARNISEARRIASVALAALKELHGEEADDMFFSGAEHLREGVVYVDLLYRFLGSKGKEPTYDLMEETLSKVIDATHGLRQMLYGRPVGSLNKESVAVSERFFSFLIDEVERNILLREKEEEEQFRDECSRLASL